MCAADSQRYRPRMILGTIDALPHNLLRHPGIVTGFDYLATNDAHVLSLGKHPIDGERLFIILENSAMKGSGGAQLEAHRRFIDVHLCLEGTETIGWKKTTDCTAIEKPYSADHDVALFGDEPERWIDLPKDAFAIFFPDDAHAPHAGTTPMKKAVLKIAVEW